MKKKRFVAVLICLIMVVAAPLSAHGANKVLPEGAAVSMTPTMMKLTYDNCEVTWNGVAGKLIESPIIDNAYFICVPIKSTSAAWSHSDLCDIKFTEATKIAGRSIDVTFHVNSFQDTPASVSGSGQYYTMIGSVSPNGFGFGGGHTPSGCVEYVSRKQYDITTTITWNDTGGVVDVPFLQFVSDLDYSSAVHYESVTPVSGIANTYRYSICDLNISGNTFTGKDARDDLDARKSVYLQSGSGTYRVSLTASSGLGMGVMVFNQYGMLENPVKAVQ